VVVNPVAEKLGELGLPRPVFELAARDWDVVIVGGGHNGLTAAAYLARGGKSVLVCERRERIGGACTLERPFSDERYVVSPCAYVVGVLDELVISELGLRERGVRISLADPALFIPFEDGTAFAEFADEERTLGGLRDLGISENDIKGFQAYGESFDLARRRLRKGERDAWVGESPSRAELEEMLGDQDLIDLVFDASISDVLDAHVKDQRLKDALYGQGLIAAYGGPKDKGTAMIHLMHHMGELGPDNPGAWGYVKGGMGMVSFAICDAALEAGAEVACGVPVASVKPGEGVELEDGTLIRAATVISNADPKRLLTMLDAGGANGAVPAEFRDRLDAWKVRSPVVKVNAALTALPRWTATGGETWPAAGTVNCRVGLDEAQAAFERADRGELAIGFTEIYSQTADDPTVAPPDRHVISVFCQYAPHGKTVADWDGGLREQAADQVFAMIERFAPGFREQIVEYEVLGPPDIEERIGLTGGCIFQGECSPDQMWANRLSSRTPVESLYLCGAATHPGGSVIGLNGRNAAMAVLADLS
jgi:phytoene dehydrogenase-like protein